MVTDETNTYQGESGAASATAAPTVVVLFTRSAPSCKVVPARQPLRIGRAVTADLMLEEEMASRDHVHLSFDGEALVVTDTGSKNGSFLDGVQVQGPMRVTGRAILRVGRTLLLLDAHGARFARGGVIVDQGRVYGPEMRQVRARVERAGGQGDIQLIIGESGTGKQDTARDYHAVSTHARGPFIEINCATIDRNIADRELFGAKKGAYSGALDAPGHFVAAEGGTLFLDEIGETELAVQAKLLRAVETRTIQPVGASVARAVDLFLCAGTNVDLALAVQQGRFRTDLYMRLAKNEVRLPPLRERPEEIPYLIEEGIRRACGSDLRPMPVTTGVVERCLIYSWEGQNVRGLFNQIGKALARAHEAGAREISLEHFELPRPAIAPETARPRARSAPPPPAFEPVAAGGAAADVAQRVLAVYAETKSASRAGLAAGVSRQHAYRVLKKHGIDVGKGGRDDGDD